MRENTTVVIAVLLLGLGGARLIADEPWSIESSADWTQAKAAANKVAIEEDAVVLEAPGEGQWTSKWHDWQGAVDSGEVRVEAEIDLFDNKTIETVVKGSEKPYTDADGAYRFHSLPAGEYDVHIDPETLPFGYHPLGPSVMAVLVNESTGAGPYTFRASRPVHVTEF